MQQETAPTQESPAPEPEIKQEDAGWKAPEYVMLGEEKIPWDKASHYLGQGRHYAQNAAQLNQRHAELQNLAAKYKGFDRYSEIDSYVKQNPQWWEFVEKQWNDRETTQTPGLDPNLLKPFEEKYQKLESMVTPLVESHQMRQRMDEDKALDEEITKVKEKYADVDFSVTDKNGDTFETQVLKHAYAKGFGSFRTAFLDLHGDKLFEIARANGSSKEAATKATQQKQGFLGKTTVPQKSAAPLNVSKMSWEQLHEQAKKSVGI